MTTEEMEAVDKLIEPGIPMGGQIGRYAHWLVKLRKRIQEVEAERDAANRRAAEDTAACIEAERRVDEVMNVMAAASGHDQESVEEVVRAAGAKIEKLEERVFMLEAERDDARRERNDAQAMLVRVSKVLGVSLEALVEDASLAVLDRDNARRERDEAIRARNDALLEIARLRAILDGRPAMEATDA